jgi:hypothetical protein
MNQHPHFYIHWLIKADEDMKRQRWMNRRSFIGSSDALGFQHSKVWGSSASALDELAVLASVHLVVVSKAHRNIWSLTPLAPDGPMLYSGSFDVHVYIIPRRTT